MNKILANVIDALTCWIALVVYAIALIALSWGWAGGYISIFWAIILVAVLISELLSKLFSPEKRTVTNNVRAEVVKGGWRIWTMLIMWLAFSVTLFFHFIKPLIVGG